MLRKLAIPDQIHFPLKTNDSLNDFLRVQIREEKQTLD
jgi:hypothetical protein